MLQKQYKSGAKQLFRLDIAVDSVDVCLGHWLSTEIPGLERSEALRIIDIGGVQLDGRRVSVSMQSLAAGSKVELHTDGQSLDPFLLRPEHILFRDKYLLVLNKPAGIDTQPTAARYKGTLYAALKVLLGPAAGRKKPELGMIQRLDRGTSGLMVFSTHKQSHRGLSKIFLEHRVEKGYLAMVQHPPEPASAEIRSMLARSRRLNRMVEVERGGKNAITRYRTRISNSAAALLEIELLTGRSHQIRAHLSLAGSPLLGDSLYGGLSDLAGLRLERPMLLAGHLAFEHPVTAQWLEFNLPLPADMQQLYDTLFRVTD